MHITWTVTFVLVVYLGIVSCNPNTNLDTSDSPANSDNSEYSKPADPGNATTQLRNQNPVYFDITDALNNRNLSEIQSILENTWKVYYSTDLPLTEIKNLDWIVDFLHSSNSKLCLRLAFQMTTNRSDLDWQRIVDYRSPSAITNDDEESERFLSFKNLICGVVLDFQLGSRQAPKNINNESFLYLKKWEISFTKYAKKIMREVFKGKQIPVGVTYNEIQVEREFLKSFKIIRELEIKHADFLIINVEHSPITEMPLTYDQFMYHYVDLSWKNKQFLGISNNSNLNSTETQKINVSYMSSWTKWDSSSYPYNRIPYYEAIVNSSKNEYLTLFQNYVARLVRFRSIKIGMISGSNFNFERARRWTHDGPYSMGSHILPHFKFYDTDTSICSAKLMLNTLSKFYDDAMAVNEFTWSALARSSKELIKTSNTECSTHTNKTIQPPENVILFASDGIGAQWNKTKESFMDLVANYSRVAGMHLRTIVFSGNDLKENVKEYPQPYLAPPTTSRYQSPVFYDMPSAYSARDTGIASFVQSLAEENETAIGCLVDLSLVQIFEPLDVLYHTQFNCKPIINNVTVIVWRYTVNFNLKSGNQLKMDDGFETEHLLRKLFNMLAAKNVIQTHSPDKKVIFQIETEDKMLWEPNSFDLPDSYSRLVFQAELKRMIFSWAKLHEVKVMHTPETLKI